MASKPRTATRRRGRAKRPTPTPVKRHFHFTKLPKRVTDWEIPVAPSVLDEEYPEDKRRQ